MKNKSGNTKERKELSFREIESLMRTPACVIVPREEVLDVEDDREWFGVSTDATRREFREETGHAP